MYLCLESSSCSGFDGGFSKNIASVLRGKPGIVLLKRPNTGVDFMVSVFLRLLLFFCSSLLVRDETV